MTNVPHEEGGKRPPEEMRLRSSRPPVTRLSRRVLLSLAAAAAIGVAGALFFALEPQHRIASSELYNTNNHDAPDGLANLPRDYAGLPKPVPQLGPPLPGDLGPPIANTDASRDADGRRSRAAAHRARTGGGTCQPSLCDEQCRSNRRPILADGRRPGTGCAWWIDRSRVAGPQARLSNRHCRPAHNQP